MWLSSAQVPIALREITRTIKESGLADEFKVIESSEAMKWLQLHCPKAHVQVWEFVQTHGHRGFEEFELITETWSMRPEKFLAIIQVSYLSKDSCFYIYSTLISPARHPWFRGRLHAPPAIT